MNARAFRLLLIIVCAGGLATPLSACAVRPSKLEPPEGADKLAFPKTYPSPDPVLAPAPPKAPPGPVLLPVQPVIPSPETDPANTTNALP